MSVKRVFKLPNQNFEINGSVSSLITNNFGSYFAIDENLSYQGWYLISPKDWRMEKIIESITPLDLDCEEVHNQVHSIRRKYGEKIQDTIFTYQKTLLYSTLGLSDKKVRLTLDNRESYEGSELGRNYEINFEKDYLQIKFTKDGVEKFLIVKGVKSFDTINSWKEKEYYFDKHRNSSSNYWVYEALDFIPSHHVVFAYADSLQEARTLADISYFHFDDIISNIQTKSYSKLLSSNQITGQVGIATSFAANSLRSLVNNFSFDHRLMPGIYAGLPWFFQIWSRDELISLGGLISLAKEQHDEDLFNTIKSILSRHINSIRPDGDLPNRFPKSELGSVDALGWLAKRLKDFLIVLDDEKLLYTLFSPEELVGWSNHLKDALEKSKQSRLKEGLFFNNKKETWMDTSHHDDGRVGFRVEIQALFYALYDSIIFIEKLVKSPFVNELISEQNNFKKSFRNLFLKKDFSGLLVDGYDDKNIVDRTYRPNVFLAAYLASDMLTNKEWEMVFDSHLKQLYLPWGGLSTIGKDHSLYNPVYTGENNQSYHRGDSWYFVNNLAALVLNKFDSKKYSQQIRSIEFASSNDCLALGFSGHISELSSASFQEAEGCMAQAWSAATFVELVLHRYTED